MAFITVHHFAIWGYFIGNEVHTVQPNTVWLQFLELFGKIGVDLFILITDYFAINPRPTFKKIWQLTNTLWQNIFHVRDFADTMATPAFIGYSLFVMVVIVIGAILIDKLLGRILIRPAQVLLALEMLATRYVTRWFKSLIKLTGYQPEH